MTQVTLNVPDISCNHCKMSIEGAVNALTGIESAVVNIEGRSVDVAFDDGAQSLEAIVNAIEEQGYEVANN